MKETIATSITTSTSSASSNSDLDIVTGASNNNNNLLLNTAILYQSFKEPTKGCGHSVPFDSIIQLVHSSTTKLTCPICGIHISYIEDGYMSSSQNNDDDISYITFMYGKIIYRLSIVEYEQQQESTESKHWFYNYFWNKTNRTTTSKTKMTAQERIANVLGFDYEHSMKVKKLYSIHLFIYFYPNEFIRDILILNFILFLNYYYFLFTSCYYCYVEYLLLLSFYNKILSKGKVIYPTTTINTNKYDISNMLIEYSIQQTLHGKINFVVIGTCVDTQQKLLQQEKQKKQHSLSSSSSIENTNNNTSIINQMYQFMSLIIHYGIETIRISLIVSVQIIYYICSTTYHFIIGPLFGRTYQPNNNNDRRH